MTRSKHCQCCYSLLSIILLKFSCLCFRVCWTAMVGTLYYCVVIHDTPCRYRSTTGKPSPSLLCWMNLMVKTGNYRAHFQYTSDDLVSSTGTQTGTTLSCSNYAIYYSVKPIYLLIANRCAAFQVYEPNVSIRRRIYVLSYTVKLSLLPWLLSGLAVAVLLFTKVITLLFPLVVLFASNFYVILSYQRDIHDDDDEGAEVAGIVSIF